MNFGRRVKYETAVSAPIFPHYTEGRVDNAPVITTPSGHSFCLSLSWTLQNADCGENLKLRCDAKDPNHQEISIHFGKIMDFCVETRSVFIRQIAQESAVWRSWWLMSGSSQVGLKDPRITTLLTYFSRLRSKYKGNHCSWNRAVHLILAILSQKRQQQFRNIYIPAQFIDGFQLTSGT